MIKSKVVLGLILFNVFFLLTTAFSKANDSKSSVILFEENKNQLDSRVFFKADLVKNGKVYFEKDRFTYLFYNLSEIEELHHPNIHDASEEKKNEVHFHSYQMNFIGANPAANVIAATTPVKSYKNYFIGNDPSKWASHVKSYEGIRYSEVYPDIDINIYSSGNYMKYDFIIAPNTNPNVIQMKYDGLNNISMGEEGSLVLKMSFGEVMEQHPSAYQFINGRKVVVKCRYVLTGNKVSFAFPKGYDKSKELIIDPTIICSTYTGSTSDNWGFTATYDDDGNMYTGGVAFTVGYPITNGAFQSAFAGGGVGGNPWPFDITVTKYNPLGTDLIYSTYLGGSDNEQPHSILVNDNKELVLFGRTYSANFPTVMGSYDVTYNGGSDIIVTKFNATGTALLASTFIGGTFDDGVNIDAREDTVHSLKFNYGDDARGEIIVDNNNNYYLTASTKSTNFPTTAGCYKNTLDGTQDACVFKLNNNLSSLIWSTYLGGGNEDGGYSIGLDASKNLYITGGTNSTDFPTTVGVLHPTFQGGEADGFIAHLKNDGTAILQSTYIGTDKYDQSYILQIDKQYNVYIYGQTMGAYPVSAGVYSNPNGKQFIHKLNTTLSSTMYSTVFGSGRPNPDISPCAFSVDTCQNVYISGWGRSFLLSHINYPGSCSDMPTTGDAFQTTTDGADFYLLALRKDALSLGYASYFGEFGGVPEHVDGGTSRFDKRGVVYQSVCAGCGGSSDFPTTPGAWSNTNNSANCNNAAFKINFVLFSPQAVATISAPDTACAPYKIAINNGSSAATSYVWDFGDNTTTSTDTNVVHTYNSPGTYKVRLIAENPASCNMYDTTYLTITVLERANPELGNDTIVCEAPNILLDAGSGNFTYLWSTGATTKTYNAISAGIYWVKVTNGYCDESDTITISLAPEAIVTLPNDTTVCQGDILTLTAAGNSTNYNWSTGATTSSINVTVAGQYWLKGITASGCFTFDTINVDFVAPPVIDLPSTVVLCNGDSAIMDAENPGKTYLWSTGNTTQLITAKSTGTYWVKVFNGDCYKTDTIIVEEQVPPVFRRNVDLCDSEEGQILVNAGGNEGSLYQWSNGATTQKNYLNSPGIYWVIITSGNCVQYDTIEVTGGFYSGGEIFVPNTFTPDGDGLNDIFKGYGDGITYFDMKIFNRWGELYFETTDITNGWDGKLKGRLVEMEVYVWKIEYQTKCTGNEKKHKIGHVLLYK